MSKYESYEEKIIDGIEADLQLVAERDCYHEEDSSLLFTRHILTWYVCMKSSKTKRKITCI
jgi:hypothetical protein